MTWHPELVTAAVDGEVIVMGLIRGQYVGLDDIGSALWRLLEQPRTVRDLSAQLCQLYRGDADVIITDVQGFLGELMAIDLIHVVDPGAADR